LFVQISGSGSLVNPLARRAPTMKRWSLDARSEGSTRPPSPRSSGRKRLLTLSSPAAFWFSPAAIGERGGRSLFALAWRPVCATCLVL